MQNTSFIKILTGLALIGLLGGCDLAEADKTYVTNQTYVTNETYVTNNYTNGEGTDANAQMIVMMEQFQTQFSMMMMMLAEMQVMPDSGDINTATTDMTEYNDQMAALLEILSQMQGMTTDPTSGVNVDLNELMAQFQVSMEPMMSVIPQMFSMAEQGMDMMDPEKYIPEMMIMAGEMLEFSKYMVDTAAELMKDPNVDHELYVNAMLRLSDDIGLMADRILVMADKMLVMGEMMQEVALVMLDLMAETQTNLLTAQENFNALLLGLAGGSPEGEPLNSPN